MSYFKYLVSFSYSKIQIQKTIMGRHSSSIVFAFLFFFAMASASTQSCQMHSHSSFQISSSLTISQFEIVISMSEKLALQEKKVMIGVSAFEGNHQNHSLTFMPEKVMVQPELKDEIVPFNYKHQNTYFLALSHKVERQNSHFISLEVTVGSATSQYLLPGFNQKMNSISLDRLFKCHKTMISISNNWAQSDHYDLSFFTQDKEESIWLFGSQVKSEWRQLYNNVYFGQAVVEKSKLPLKIWLSNGRQCEIEVNSLPSSVRTLEKGKKFSLSELLEWILPLPMTQKSWKPTMEEL